jgi:hypothetical protein
MKYIITESQVKSLQPTIQSLIDSELNLLRAESENWGMSEMDEILEIQSVDRIVVDRVVSFDKIKVYINIYKNSNRNDFNNLRGEIQYKLEDWLPNIELYIENIIDDSEFGPGIDW